MDEQKLIKYLALKQQIADLEKQIKPIKSEIEAAGPMETENFSVRIMEVEQNRVVDAGTLLEALGPVMVTEKALIRTSTYNKLDVKRKERMAA
jgi:GH15 family glucan-1,4-alpha-glucosidase